MIMIKNMEFQEGFISYIVKRVLERCQDSLKELERDTAKLEKITPPFPKISYDEAIKILQENGSETKWGDDLGAPDETILGEKFDKPVFVYNYPKKTKAFYMKENKDNPDTVLCSDLIAPEGYGEIIGGSQREDDLELLEKRIHEENLPIDAYNWYLDLRKYGSVVHSGFGMGIERFVTWICGTQHIREAIPFPRTIYRIYP